MHKEQAMTNWLQEIEATIQRLENNTHDRGEVAQSRYEGYIAGLKQAKLIMERQNKPAN